MSKKILIAPNSYKECADSPAAADLFSKHLVLNKDYSIISKPVSDGGDGFLSVCESNFNLEVLEYEISTPYDNSTFKCKAGYSSSLKVIFIESALVLGMRRIPKAKRHPVNLNSKGMGELIKLIREDSEKGKIKVEKVIIGIGGTGTNDLGAGMLPEFGWKFYDSENNEVKVIPGNFSKIARIDGSKIELPFKTEVILDVNNSLLGFNGATMTYGRQKGSTEPELEIIEKGFNDFLNLLYSNKLMHSFQELSGAGGGLAAGFTLFFGAESKTASEFLLNELKFNELREQVDFLITGEGAFDEQSLMKKGTGILIDLFENYAEKIFLCCGKIDESVKGKIASNVVPVELSKYFKNTEESVKNFEKGVKLACNEISNMILS